MEKLDIDFLKCQFVGCNDRWTVDAGWKKCSKHAWQIDNYKAPDLKEVFKNSSPVKHWQDDKEAF